MRIPGVIIVYNANLRDVISNLRTYIDVLDVLYIFDNSDNGIHCKRELNENFTNIEYISFNENKGIAFALNYCADIAFEAGYEWLLTMDQDSSFISADCFRTYLLSIKENLTDEVAFFSPLYPEESGMDRFFTSGSVMNLQAWQSIGKFDEKLFIDEVDGDYIYRLLAANFKLIKIKTVELNHKLGDRCSKQIFGKTLCSDNHSGLRKYYITRNRVYLFKRRPKMRKFYLYDSIYKFISFILVETNRFNKITMIIIGMFDGLFNNMGRYKNS